MSPEFGPCSPGEMRIDRSKRFESAQDYLGRSVKLDLGDPVVALAPRAESQGDE